MNKTFIIAKKELYRFFTDRRLLFSTVLLPGLMVYIIYTFMGSAFSSMFGQGAEAPRVLSVNTPASITAIAAEPQYGFGIIDIDSEEDGFMSLSQVGSILGRLYPDFDTRNYGFTKLHKLIEYTGDFETRYDQIPGGGKNLMVKNK